jgi:hypothetical protein
MFKNTARWVWKTKIGYKSFFELLILGAINLGGPFTYCGQKFWSKKFVDVKNSFLGGSGNFSGQYFFGVNIFEVS